MHRRWSFSSTLRVRGSITMSRGSFSLSAVAQYGTKGVLYNTLPRFVDWCACPTAEQSVITPPRYMRGLAVARCICFVGIAMSPDQYGALNIVQAFPSQNCAGRWRTPLMFATYSTGSIFRIVAMCMDPKIVPSRVLQLQVSAWVLTDLLKTRSSRSSTFCFPACCPATTCPSRSTC